MQNQVSIENMYFTTSTINDWMPLLERPALRKIVCESLQFLIDNGRIRLHGYVIMPNHLHTIFSVNDSYQLDVIFRDFHKFTSQQIIKKLRDQKDKTLEYLRSKKKDRTYQVWKEYHAPKRIESEAFFKQKLEYMHHNPCQDRWKLCDCPEKYTYSSAGDYYLGQKGPLELDLIQW
jgi:REP element-mobilizing transposase RayT